MDVASGAVASSNDAVLVNLLDVLESVVEVRETEGHAVHVAVIGSVVDQLNCSSFPSQFSHSVLGLCLFHQFLESGEGVSELCLSDLFSSFDFLFQGFFEGFPRLFQLIGDCDSTDELCLRNLFNISVNLCDFGLKLCLLSLFVQQL